MPTSLKSLRYRFIIPAFLLFLILSFTISLNLALIIPSLTVTYLIFNPWLDSEIFDSKAMRLLLAPFFYFLILQCVLLCVWVADKNFPLDSSIPLCLVFLLLFYGYQYYFQRKSRSKPSAPARTFINLSDYAALAIAAGITLLIVLSSLAAGGFTNKSGLLNLVNGNVDDSEHLALMNDRLQFNRGVMYHTAAASHTRSPQTYPIGWHSANAAVIKAFQPSIRPGIQSLGAYVISKVFWFFILIYVFIKTVFVVLEALYEKTRLSSPYLPWLIGSSVLFAGTFLVDFFSNGFYSFFPQLTSLLLLVIAALQISRPKQQASTFYVTLPLLLVLAISGSLTWLLILPALLLAILIFLIQRLREVGMASFRKEVIMNVAHYLPLYLLLGLAALVQYYTFIGSSAVPFLQSITLPGGTPVYGMAFYMFVAVGLALCLALAGKLAVRSINALAVLISCLLLLSSVIYIIQIINTGQNAYYYYKIMSAAATIAIPVAVAGYALGFAALSRKLGFAAVSWATLIFLLLLVPQLDSPTALRYLGGHREVSRQVNTSVYTQIKASPVEKYNDSSYTFYFVRGKTFEDDFGTTLVKSSKPGSVCYNTTRSVFSSGGSLASGLNDIGRDCGGTYTVTILTARSNVSSLKASVEAAGLEKTISIGTYQNPVI